MIKTGCLQGVDGDQEDGPYLSQRIVVRGYWHSGQNWGDGESENPHLE